MDPGTFLEIVPYRCVCGNVLALTGDMARECLQCGRQVPVNAFHNGDVTIIGAGEAESLDANSAPDLMLRQRLRHFRILAPLARGGMGVVYRAVDESLERDVALKVIRSRRQNQSESRLVKRLLEEARAQARVVHPNVVQVYYVDAQGEIPFLAMELVSGMTLEERFHEGPMEFSEIIELAIQTTRALKAAAQFHIVHGDIKPANLLISKEGTIKLSDFGLARPVDHLSDEFVGISGTPNYLSPEACRGEATHHQSDMYSLGVVLFQATFGRLPYPVTGGSLMARLRVHLESSVEYPQRWPAEIPLEWKTVLETLLAKDPDARYVNYDQMLTALERLRPVELPIAGRIVRGLAWIMDLAMLVVLVLILQDAGRQIFANSEPALFGVGMALVLGAFLTTAAIVQYRTGVSPGKHLLQLRIVDPHGLAVRRPILLLRGFLQQLPLWGIVGLKLMSACHLPTLGWTVALVISSISLIDALFAMVRSDRRSFHDLLCDTSVVLNTIICKPLRRPDRRAMARYVSSDDPTAFGNDQEISTQSAVRSAVH